MLWHISIISSRQEYLYRNLYIKEALSMQIISADMGRSESKFYSNNQKIKFKSVIGEWHQRNLNTEGNYDININGLNYFIGELALRESYLPREMTTESKIHEETLLLFLTGISLLARDNESIAITTGLPINQFNPLIRDEIVSLLKGRHIVSFPGLRVKQLSINQITICPESGGTYFYEAKKNPKLKHGKVRVINIGSRTINYCTIKDGNYINKDSGTLLYGSIQLNNSKANLQEFSRKIYADLSSKWIDYNEDEDIILISGGGILLLDNYLKQYFKKAIVSDDPIYSDVLGFYEIGIAKYGMLNATIAK